MTLADARHSKVENEGKTAQLPSKQGTSPEQTSVLEESILKISGQLSTISRNQKYFRTRENRNFSTVNSTEKRIINFSMIQCGLVICMGALQVFVVRFFFQVRFRLGVCHRGLANSTICRVHARATYKWLSEAMNYGFVRRTLQMGAWYGNVYVWGDGWHEVFAGNSGIKATKRYSCM